MRKLGVFLLALVVVPALAYGVISAVRWTGVAYWLSDERIAAQQMVGAASNGHRSEVRRVLRSGRVAGNAANEYGFSALMGAAISDDVAIAETLLDAGAMPNAAVRIPSPQGPAGVTALMIASQRGGYTVAELLLKRGANPNLVIEQGAHRGDSALAMAVLSGDPRVVDLLLRWGARPDQYRYSNDNIARSPLYLAAVRGRIDIAERLERAGVRVDDRIRQGDLEGYTELMMIADSPSVPAGFVRWAVRRSRALDAASTSMLCRGCTAVAVAALRGNALAADELVAAGARRGLASAARYAMDSGHMQLAARLSARVASCGPVVCGP